MDINADSVVLFYKIKYVVYLIVPILDGALCGTMLKKMIRLPLMSVWNGVPKTASSSYYMDLGMLGHLGSFNGEWKGPTHVRPTILGSQVWILYTEYSVVSQFPVVSVVPYTEYRVDQNLVLGPWYYQSGTCSTAAASLHNSTSLGSQVWGPYTEYSVDQK